MKRFLLFLLLLTLTAISTQAQDLLTKQNGEELQVKVLELTPTEVRYKRTDNPDGPLISVRRSDVFMIRYANGTKEVLGPNQNAPQIIAGAPPRTGPVVPGDEESAYEEIHLNGPRIGFTILSQGVINKINARESSYLKDLNPFITQFGWQFETRIFRMPNGTAGLLEIVPLIGGLEQGKFIPSINALVGIRGPKGFEFGVGPNLTPVSANVALAIGTSFRSNGINFPVNFAVVPGNGGARFSLLVGFNSRRR